MWWYAVLMAAILIPMYASLAYSDYTKNQCKISFAQSNRTADDIANIFN